jgi:uncharacterized sporulation protein YeaH/YhbH (DUF444 family)
MQLTKDILEERYAAADYNVYAAQASDGDNQGGDNALTKSLIEELLPKMQAFFYAETKSGQAWRPDQSDIWDMYKDIEASNSGRFFMGRIKETRDVYKIFREFFTPKGEAAPSASGKPSANALRLEP